MIHNRTEFSEYCLRKLGAPVINIDVTNEQVEDRIDEALKFYYDYHYDGSSKVYLKHQITQDDIDNGYITVDESINGVLKIFDIGTSGTTSSMFSIEYQIALNDLYTFSGTDLVPYWMAVENLQFMQQLISGSPLLRFNQRSNKLYIDINKNKLTVGKFILIEAYQISDPNVMSEVWNDRWLCKYATALIKRQWGNNITKFNNVQLPGGVTFNGENILNSAEEEIAKLEQDLMDNGLLTAYEIG